MFSGFGNGLLQSTAFVALTARVSKTDMATTCSTFYMMSNVGQAVGLAITNVVTQNVLRRGLKRELADNPMRDKVSQRALQEPLR